MALTSLGEKYKGAADKIGIKNLAPKDINDTLRQGGTFIFRGNEALLEHFDARLATIVTWMTFLHFVQNKFMDIKTGSRLSSSFIIYKLKYSIRWMTLPLS